MLLIDEQKDVYYLIDETTQEILEGYKIPNFTKEQVQKIVDGYNIDPDFVWKDKYLKDIAYLRNWCAVCDIQNLVQEKAQALSQIDVLKTKVGS